MTDLQSQSKITDKIIANLVRLMVLLIIVMLAVQLGVLATLGTKGGEVTSVRQQRKYYREEIDSIKADIDSAKTLAQIEDGIKVVYGNGRSTAKPIEINIPRQDNTVGLLNNGN